jgi:hypothetical protein
MKWYSGRHAANSTIVASSQMRAVFASLSDVNSNRILDAGFIVRFCMLRAAEQALCVRRAAAAQVVEPIERYGAKRPWISKSASSEAPATPLEPPS